MDLKRSHTPRPDWGKVFLALPEVSYVDSIAPTPLNVKVFSDVLHPIQARSNTFQSLLFMPAKMEEPNGL